MFRNNKHFKSVEMKPTEYVVGFFGNFDMNRPNGKLNRFGCYVANSENEFQTEEYDIVVNEFTVYPPKPEEPMEEEEESEEKPLVIEELLPDPDTDWN